MEFNGQPKTFCVPREADPSLRDPAHIYASNDFFNHIANICGIQYAGVFAPLDGSKPPQVQRTDAVGPRALDCWECVWLWPRGHCWDMSVRALLNADLAELAENRWRGGRGDSYDVEAEIQNYLCLGYIKKIPL